MSSERAGANGPVSSHGAGEGGTQDDSGSPILDRSIQDQIGDRLRAMYGELSDQPLPDRFVSILQRLGNE